MKPVHLERLDSTFQKDDKGRYFFDGKSFFDCSAINILNSSVDTVRQLYRGRIKPHVMDLFKDECVFLGGYEWVTGRVSRDSGYQYRLQNNQLGLVLLIKNHNVKIDSEGPHLKIEASPHLINDQSPQALQSLMDDLANQLLDYCEYNQCAVHLCIDYQGWTPPGNLVANMHCRSRNVRQFDGVDTIDFASISATYNRGQSYLFGSASGMQLAVYNKSLQAKAIDKLDYWQSVWRSYDDPFDCENPSNYSEEMPVWRIEFRFHHSVVQQFAEGSTIAGQSLFFKNFYQLSGHLDGLLNYGFESFRLMHDSKYLSPVWTIFQQDIRVNVGADSLLDKTHYKRYYKTSSGFSGKNIELLLGNAISLAARENLTASQLIKALKALPFWKTILQFYNDKDMTQKDFYEHIKKLLKERYLRWGRGV